MAPVRSLVRYRLELETKSAKRWGEWSKPAHVIVSGKERLRLQPVSPAGIKGMALLKQAAEITLRVGSARSVPVSA